MENIYFSILTFCVYPSFINSDKKWTYAVYDCTCIHKPVAIMRSIMENNLNYWDEVIVINKLVSDVIHLYPINQYWCEYKCTLKIGMKKKKKKIFILTLVNMLRYQIFQMNCYRNQEHLRCNGILIISKA